MIDDTMFNADNQKIKSERNNHISEITIETVARSFLRDTKKYGFKAVDYIKIVNKIIDFSLDPNSFPKDIKKLSGFIKKDVPSSLPIVSNNLIIRKFHFQSDYDLAQMWLQEELGRFFIISRVNSNSVTLKELLTKQENIFGVITTLAHIPIGLVAYLECDPIAHKAELRKLIGEPSYRQHGFAKEATEYWINYGITSLKLKKIYLNTLDTQVRNIKLNEELGFKIEGLLKNECFFDDDLHDVLRMSLVIE